MNQLLELFKNTFIFVSKDGEEIRQVAVVAVIDEEDPAGPFVYYTTDNGDEGMLCLSDNSVSVDDFYFYRLEEIYPSQFQS